MQVAPLYWCISAMLCVLPMATPAVVAPTTMVVSSSSFGGSVASFNVKNVSSPLSRAVRTIITGVGYRNTLCFIWRLPIRLCRGADIARRSYYCLVCFTHAIFLRTHILHFVKQFLHHVDGLSAHPLRHGACSETHLLALMTVLSMMPFRWFLTSVNILQKFGTFLTTNKCHLSFGFV